MYTTDWKSIAVHMLDFEGSPASGVVEYGRVTLRGGRIDSTATALCRPRGCIGQRDREVHGISDADVAHAEAFSERYAEFVGLRRDGVYAAHNRHAENTFLKDTWPLPPVVPDWRTGQGSAQEWGPWIDTLGIYKGLYPGRDSFALGDLIAEFRLDPELGDLAGRYCPPDRRKPHCALFDALASALLLLRLEQEEDLRGRITIGWLLQLSEGSQGQQELF